jgi:hypothetical protein
MVRSLRGVAATLLFVVSGIAAAAPQLLIPVSRPQLNGGTLVTPKNATGTAVRFNADEVFSLVPGAEVELTLPNGSRHTYLFESTVSHGAGMTTWIARSPLTGTNERAVITVSEVGAWGWMKTAHGEFRIYPGDGADRLVASAPIDLSPKGGGSDAILAPPDGPGEMPFKGIPTWVPTPMAPKAFPMPKATPTPSARVDVMFIYTRDLATKLGAGLLPMLNNLVASANLAYADSEVALVMRMVNATLIDLDNTNGSGAVLDGMGGFGAHASTFQSLTWGAASLRNTFGADYVALVRDGPQDTGGIGNLTKNPTPGTVVSTLGYSVNNFCATGCEGIFVHEVGHNMGLHHDRATIAKDSGTGTVDETGVFADSHGHYTCQNGLTCNPFAANGALTCTTGYARCPFSAPDYNKNDFGTIMSYFSPKVSRFSNAAASLTCVPSGGDAAAPRPCGILGQTDEARGMNLIRNNLAAYRTETIANLPGSLQFTNIVYSSTEANGTLTFTVSRATGSAGAVSVSYAVTAGTASAGSDFTVTAGVLSWANGDAANKTFTVTLANDGLAEAVESLTATLSAPAGATGVHLGYPSVALGLILETWPLGNTAPVGFSNPAGPAWSVASDSFDAAGPAGFSWKSGPLAFICAPPAFNCGPPTPAVPPPSVTQYSGNFASGNVAFSYRVNSYPSQGFFEFLVDGNVVFSDSGDSGWKSFTYPITSGAHTLQWRYRAVLYFPCSIAGDPPPQGLANCLDHAWIDHVSLPLALASSTTTLVSSVNPSSSGQSVTFTATVSGGSGTPRCRLRKPRPCRNR